MTDIPKHITQQTKIAVVKYYQLKPMTVRDLAQHFKISQPSAIKILDQYRIKRYSKVKLFSPNLDEHYFDTIDTEAKAYFLGLIITDGCIHSTKGKQPLVSIVLHEQDRYILETFKREIHSNKRITTDGRGCAGINILSNTMVNALRKYGVTERKSLNTIFPADVPKHLMRHVIRGILDGDGSVSYYARKTRKCHIKAIRFCQGNEQFLKDLVDYLCLYCSVDKVSLYKEKESLWSIAYRKNNSLAKIIDYLYKDSHIYLNRKKNICDLIIKELEEYGNTEITTGIKEPVVS